MKVRTTVLLMYLMLFLVVVGVFAFKVFYAQAAIFDHVQSRYGNGTTLAFSSNTTAGNTIVIGVCSSVAQSVSDAQNNAYYTAVDYSSGWCGRLQVFYAHNIVGGSTDTITFSGGGTRDYVIAEFTGDIIPDVSRTNNVGGTVDTGLTPTTAVASELIYGFLGSNTSSPTAGSGFTVGASGVNNANVANEYKTVTALGEYNATFNPACVACDVTVVTFRASPNLTPSSQLSFRGLISPSQQRGIVTWMDSGGDATGDLNMYSQTAATAGTFAVDNTVSHTGSRSLKAVSTATGNNSENFNQLNSVVSAGSAASIWIKFNNAATGDRKFMAIANIPSASDPLSVGITSGGNIKLQPVGLTAKTGTAVLTTGVWYRISISYVISSASNWGAIVYVNGVKDISAGNGTNGGGSSDGSLTSTAVDSFMAGIGCDVAGAFTSTQSGSYTVWVDDIYVDNRTDKTDTGDVRVTAKQPKTVNNNNFDTTGGTGAVNDVPLAIANYRQQQATTQASQDYTIYGANDTGDGSANLSNSAILGRMAWIWAAASSTVSSPQIIDNGSTTAITLTTTKSLFTHIMPSSVYPTSTASVGLRSGGTSADNTLYEAGVLFAFSPMNSPIKFRVGSSGLINFR